MPEEKGIKLPGRSSFRKRYQVFQGKGSIVNLYSPELNLSEEEYKKKLEKLKNMGNVC